MASLRHIRIQTEFGASTAVASSRRVGNLRRNFPAAAALLLCVALAMPVWAQKDTGSIVGTVKDASGAVVPGAKVTVRDVDRGEDFVTTTNGLGEYVATPLRVARYRVTVEKEGFKKAVAGPMQLNVQDRLGVDFTLEVGTPAEVVTVTAEAPLLETETTELANVVDSRRATTLPLNGRNYAQLALLGAGVAPTEPGSRVETSFGFASNGARSLQNNYLLDGIDNNSNLGDVLNETAYVIQPSVDAIAEFKVETNAYTAEFGRGNGSILNAVIKSGTNGLHGDVYEFLRNEKFDGRNAFDQFGRQPYKQNQFGFTLGGPIIKNRTFFFGDYEGLRIRQAIPQLVLIPTPQEIGGDFTSFLTPTPAMAVDMNGNPTAQVAVDCNNKPTFIGEIFNTRLTQVSGLNPDGFCGVPITDASGNLNMFPRTQMDPLAKRLAALFPPPNVNISGNNFLSDPKKRESRNNFDIRVDHKFSDKNNFFTRFSYEVQPSFIPSPFSNALDGGSFGDGIEDNSYRSVAVSDTHVFSPKLVNEFRVGYNRIHSHRFQLNFDQNVSAQLGFPGVPFTPIIGGLPSIGFSDGTVSVGSSTFLPSDEKQNTYVLTDNVTLIRGRHTIKFGGEVRKEQFTIFQPAEARGDIGFGSDFTDNPAAPGTGGESVATFLLGIPDFGDMTNLHNVDYRRTNFATFVQDDIKVNPRLTLYAGLRYELYTTLKAAHNEQGTFQFNTLSVLAPKGQNAQLTPFLRQHIPILRTGSAGLIPPDLTNFAPRIGLAYKISSKLVLRSGYGIFYGGQEDGPYSNPSPGFNPPFFATQSWSVPCFVPSANPALGLNDCAIPQLNTLSQGYPATALSDPNVPQLYSDDPHLKTPYMQQWHLGLQYELPSDMLVDISYGGSRGLRLYAFYNGNQAVPTTDINAPTINRRPAERCTNPADPTTCDGVFDTSIPTFRSNGISNYTSLQARLEKRFSHGLQFEAAYTYSHALDDASSADLGSASNGDFRDQRFPKMDYGNADFDVRHRFVINYIYELPFGKGKPFGKNSSGVANQFIGNWQVAGIVTASTGNYFTVSDAVTNVSTSDCGGNVAANCVRPNLVGDPNGHPCDPGTFFNTCAFAPDTTVGTFGNSGRNIVRGPGFQNWDISLFKIFPVREQVRFEFRAEFFNAFNHVNPLFNHFGAIGEEPVGVERGTPQFGFPVSARLPREIQFALKFYF